MPRLSTYTLEENSPFSFIIIFVYLEYPVISIAPNANTSLTVYPLSLGSSAIMAIYTTIFLSLVITEISRGNICGYAQILFSIQVRTLANEAGKHSKRFYQQDVAIQTKLG